MFIMVIEHGFYSIHITKAKAWQGYSLPVTALKRLSFGKATVYQKLLVTVTAHDLHSALHDYSSE